jgi:hypothetical protein
LLWIGIDCIKSEMAVLTFLQLIQCLRTIFFSIVDKKGLFIGKQDSPST